MISTNNKKIWQTCWSLKDHGKNYHSVYHKKHKLGFKWLHDNYGSNHRMTDSSSNWKISTTKSRLPINKRNQIANKLINS